MPTRYFVQKIQADPPEFAASMVKDDVVTPLGRRPKIATAKRLCEQSAGRELRWDKVAWTVGTWEAVRD